MVVVVPDELDKYSDELDTCCSCFAVCGLNVHRRCQKNVANNCGINTRDMAQILQEMGITTDKLTAKGRKKVTSFKNVNILQTLQLKVSVF